MMQARPASAVGGRGPYCTCRYDTCNMLILQNVAFQCVLTSGAVQAVKKEACALELGAGAVYTANIT